MVMRGRQRRPYEGGRSVRYLKLLSAAAARANRSGRPIEVLEMITENWMLSYKRMFVRSV